MSSTPGNLDLLLDIDPSSAAAGRASDLLLRELTALTEHHWARCDPYRRAIQAMGFQRPFEFSNLTDVPSLPVSLFKEFELKSVATEEVVRILRSSGTTGQVQSRVYLDNETARLQTRALVRIFQRIIGKQRLPMLIVDQPAVLGDRRSFTARGAGVLGLANFGRDHTYALDADMRLDWGALEAFAERHAGQKVLLFGFTFMVWKYLIGELCRADRTLPFQGGLLVHSGGWKKLQDEAISREEFRGGIATATGIEVVHDFYGMVEQVGSVFVECAAGALHAPPFAAVIIRDPRTWRPVEFGGTGVIQVLSALPRSYPGHSLVTEDLGEVLPEKCSCGRPGGFRVLGRLPKAELRGCSDTHAAET